MENKFHSGLSAREVKLGIVFFPIYMLVLPFAVSYVCLILERNWSISPSDSTVNLVYYFLLFGCVIFLFREFHLKSFDEFSDNVAGSLKTLSVAFGVYFAANFLMGLLLSLVPGGFENMNTDAIVSQARENARATMVMVLFLSPFVEETLFRGLVFGSIREKNRILAYVISSLLFCILHVWQYIFTSGDFSYLIAILQYLPPSVALAWCYEKSGNIWAAIMLHMLINAFALVAIFGM